MTTQEMLLSNLRNARLREIETLSKWKADLDVLPNNAFEWGDKAAEAAARLFVLGVVESLVEKKSIRDALEVARREAWVRARWPKRSTSTMANMQQQYVLSAYAEFVAEYESWATA